MTTPTASSDNRTGLDYRQIPPRKVQVPAGIIDIHNHTRNAEASTIFVEAARAYGVTEFYTMAPLEDAPSLNEKFPGQFHFIAIPAWKIDMPVPGEEFFADWHNRVEAFAKLGAKLIKFHAAPGTCRRWQISLDDPRIQAVASHAYSLGYHFMTHVGDPKAWFYGKGVYSDGTYGTHESQFQQLERMLEKYPDRLHLGAHMGGSLESLDSLARRLEKFPHYILDTSATKWMVRAVAEQSPAAVRDFILQFEDRILFGSDNVVNEKRDWNHYASRYWAHQMLWESDFNGESPIDDPDGSKGFSPPTGAFDEKNADNVPRLVGINLPPATLTKLYRTNAERLLGKHSPSQL